MHNPLVQKLNLDLNKLAFYRGPITTYQNTDQQFHDALTSRELTLRPILKDGFGENSNGDLQFNALVKNQINELVRGVKNYFSLNPDQDFMMNPEYDSNNYYLDKGYTR
jgi:hypothetical protein